MRNQRMLMIGLIALSGAMGLTAMPTTPTLKKVTEFDLPGPPGKRFDYLTMTRMITTCSPLISAQDKCMSSICALTKSWLQRPTLPVPKALSTSQN